MREQSSKEIAKTPLVHGTNWQPSLEMALAMDPAPQIIFFMTDGVTGGGGTGWSRAWMINRFVRLRDGDAACDHYLALFRRSTLPILFNSCPPCQRPGRTAPSRASAPVAASPWTSTGRTVESPATASPHPSRAK